MESEKCLSGTQNAKTPHIYPIPLEQREKTCVKFLEIGSNEHFAQKLYGKFYMPLFCILENLLAKYLYPI